MSVVKVTHQGNFKNIEKITSNAYESNVMNILNAYGSKGVQALSSATPIDSGESASSWSYRISRTRNSFSIVWENSSLTSSGTPIVILLQYGHGTRDGGYVHGIDFINPAIQPIMDEIAEEVWKEVKGR